MSLLSNQNIIRNEGFFHGIGMFALDFLENGQELYSDYRLDTRFGEGYQPDWMEEDGEEDGFVLQ